ncbi:MAG TPA: response regulator transcription factor [Bacteroidales bacterium]|nr:response regulator transcription factor [Bacteroidales bacterium]
MNKKKVIIVDDHAIVRNGIKVLLSVFNDIKVINTASNYSELENQISTELPDIILLDIEMPEMDGISIAAILQDKYPEIKKIILSAQITEQNISDAIEAGVLALLPKDTDEDELYLAICKAYVGDHYYSNFVQELVLKNYLSNHKKDTDNNQKDVESLSSREIEIIQEFGNGLSYKEIADKLFISPRTVESHKNRILEKLNLNTIIDLVKYGIKNDLIKI